MLIPINKNSGKPHKSIEDAIKEMQNTLHLLPQLQYISFCPDFEGLIMWKVFRDKTSEIKQYTEAEFGSFRKPGAGMINLICRNEIPSETWMIGDRPEDKSAANNAGVFFIDASLWRQRFTKGIQELQGLSKGQIEFLEDIKL